MANINLNLNLNTTVNFNFEGVQGTAYKFREPTGVINIKKAGLDESFAKMQKSPKQQSKSKAKNEGKKDED